MAQQRNLTEAERAIDQISQSQWTANLETFFLNLHLDINPVIPMLLIALHY